MPATVPELVKDLKTNPQLLENLRQNPEQTLREYQQDNPKEWDAWIYRIVVLSLGLTVLIIVTGVLITLVQNTNVTNQNLITIVASIGSAAIGALAGLLAPSPRNSNS